MVTLSSELAVASGLSPKREQLVLTVSLAIVVAVAIKVVGVLLITAMLIIPAASVRPLSRTPERMVVVALMLGLVATFAGLALSYQFDTPTGPTKVCVAASLFVFVNISAALGVQRYR